MASHKVTEVIDGDTFDVTPDWWFGNETGSRVRIANFNAPETGLLGAAVAKELLDSAILGKRVHLSGKSLSYGRLVADVTVGGRDVKDLL